MKSLSRALLALTLVPGVGAPSEAADPSREDVLRHYAAVVHGAYADAARDARALATAVTRLLDSPSPDTLSGAKDAWTVARRSYGPTEAFRFYEGPIDVDPSTGEEGPELRVNAWPVNEAFLESADSAGAVGIVQNPDVSLDAATLVAHNVAADERDVTTGFHAIEFLLWGRDENPEGPGARPSSDYAPGDPVRERRRAFLRVIADLLVDDLEWLERAWRPGEENFAASLLAQPAAEGLDRAFRGLVQLVGFELAMERLAVPLDSGDQEDEQSCFSDTTDQDFRANVRGVRLLWDDGSGRALGDAVRVKDRELAKRCERSLRGVEAGVERLPRPFDAMLRASPESRSRRAAEELVSDLRRLAELLDVARVTVAAR